jgi:hypothetical protein
MRLRDEPSTRVLCVGCERPAAVANRAPRQADGCCRSDLSGGCRLVRWRGGLTTCPSSRPPSTSGTRATQPRRQAEVTTRPGPTRRAGESRRARRATRPRRAAGGGGPRKTRAGSGRASWSSPGDAYPGPERITLETDLSEGARPPPLPQSRSPAASVVLRGDVLTSAP